MWGRVNGRRVVQERFTIGYANELIEEFEPIAYGLCGLKPDELWHMTPAEASAIIEANIKFRIKPAELMTKRQEIEAKMSPDQIAEKLKMIAASHRRT